MNYVAFQSNTALIYVLFCPSFLSVQFINKTCLFVVVKYNKLLNGISRSKEVWLMKWNGYSYNLPLYSFLSIGTQTAHGNNAFAMQSAYSFISSVTFWSIVKSIYFTYYTFLGFYFRSFCVNHLFSSLMHWLWNWLMECQTLKNTACFSFKELFQIVSMLLNYL